MPDNMSTVNPERPNPNEKGLSLKKKIVIASAVAAGVVVTGVVLYGSGVFSSKKADVSSTHTHSDALEALVANLPTTGKLEDKDVKKLTTAFDKMTASSQIENLRNPKVAQAVLGNKIPLKVAKMDAKQKQALRKDLIKIQKDPNTPDEVKKAAKELQETIGEIKVSPLRKKQPPGGGGDEVVGDKEDDSGTGAPPPNEKSTKKEDQGEEDSGKDIPPPADKPTKEEGGEPSKSASGDDQKKKDASKKTAEIESLLAKPFHGPKDVAILIEELNKGNLVKPDGTKYVLDDIKEKCSIEPLIKPLLEATDPKALPKLDGVRKIITDAQKELREVSDATIKSYFKEFDHADDKSTLVAHLSKDLESLKGDNLAARFALLKSIDPATYTEEYAKTTLLKGALAMSSEDLAITFKDELDQLKDRKALIALIDKTKDVDKMVAEAEPIFNKMDNTLKTLVKFDVLEPSEVKKALEVADKINKAAVEDIKKKCKIESFIKNLLKYEDPKKSLPIPNEVAATQALVREIRAQVSSLPDTDATKSLYDGLMKNESGTVFKNEDEAIEACLEKDIQTLSGDKLLARFEMLKRLDEDKYNAQYAEDTILNRVLKGTLEDLAKVPDFRNFLTQRRELILGLRLMNTETFAKTIIDAELSLLTPHDEISIGAIQSGLSKDGSVSKEDYEYLKKMLMDNKELKISDHNGEQLTLENLAEKCSPWLSGVLDRVQRRRDDLLNVKKHEWFINFEVNALISEFSDLMAKIDESHADILSHHNLVLNTDFKKQEESIFAKDASKLKGDRLLSRYIILNSMNDATFNVDYAINTLIGKFTTADLESDPAKLTDLYDKVELCKHVNYKIEGNDIETVLDEITNEMKARYDKAADKAKLLKDDPVLLKAALLEHLGPITIELEKLESKDQHVTKNLDALLGDMADRNELVKNAIALQSAINSLDVANASSIVTYAKALAEYLRCEGATKFPVQKKSDLTPYDVKGLVAELFGATEKSNFFSSILDYDDVSYDRIMKEDEIHDPIKIAVRDQIMDDINNLRYINEVFDKNVALLKRILMKEPFSTGIEPFLNNAEDEVNMNIAKHYMQQFTEALCIPAFDEAKFKNAFSICHTINLKLAIPVAKYDMFLVLLPLLNYLREDPLAIDISSKTFDGHVPVKTFLNHMSTHPNILFESFGALVDIVLEKAVPPKVRGFWLNKLLVPSFDLLPSVDFFDLEKLPNELFTGLYDGLLAMGDMRHDMAFKAAYMKALTDDSNKNKDQNILYLWGVLDKDALVSSKRKQLESLKLSNISNENIIKARERLLTKKTEGDDNLKALYKTHYEALKKMYSGPDHDVQFPNNW